MRYFIELSYRGTKYFGWQRQPQQLSVQQELEETLSKILRESVDITGCGRTDAGVHAKGYIAHFDFTGQMPDDFTLRMNKTLSEHTSISRVAAVTDEAHARFDAKHRAYEYHIVFRKSPFEIDTAWQYPFIESLDLDKLQAAAALLLEYEDFYPFCKTNTQVKTMRCSLFRSEWEILEKEGRLVFHIAANRFLRGMVRLIVGMCLNVASGKLELDAVRKALDQQSRLPRALSVPPHGLYLVDIRYPYPVF
jgi:tRNA pseudouridine38-40 synthase